MKPSTLKLAVLFLFIDMVVARCGAEQTNATRPVTVASYYCGKGSYLEPDTVNGLKYLEAVRDVFDGKK
jgi:hypothetical protein